MHDNDAYWTAKLARAPYPHKRFTQEMMTNVEQRLQRSSRSSLRSVLTQKAYLATLAFGLLVLVPSIWATLEFGPPDTNRLTGLSQPANETSPASELQIGDGGDLAAWEDLNIEDYRDTDQTVVKFSMALLRKELGAMGGPSVPADQLWEDPVNKAPLDRYEVSSPWVAEIHVQEILSRPDSLHYILALTLTDSTQSQLAETLEVEISHRTKLIVSATVIAPVEETKNEPPAKDETVYLLAEDEEHQLTLYGTGTTVLGDNMIEGIEVFYGERSKRFDDWRITTNETYFPTVWVTDLTGDGTNDIAIMLVLGYGTGVSEKAMKVLDENLEEYTVLEPFDFAAASVESTLELTENGRIYRFRLGEVERTFSYDESDAGMWFDTPVFGNYVYYRVENGTLYGDAPIQISPGSYPIIVTVRYVFEDGVFVPAEAKFTNFDELNI